MNDHTKGGKEGKSSFHLTFSSSSYSVLLSPPFFPCETEREGEKGGNMKNANSFGIWSTNFLLKGRGEAIWKAMNFHFTLLVRLGPWK